MPRAQEGVFSRVEVMSPVDFNGDHQFTVPIRVAKYGGPKTKHFTFNSIRCAELFLIEQGLCDKSAEPIGNGLRLAGYLGAAQDLKKTLRHSLKYKQARMRHRAFQERAAA